ncbi:hypothetical protein [Pseudochrobactrum sp. MP213Fo]|uniref:hypothetical protein n=1 Tax=Pseudochrobactrum sp. MP213Fo TaxID=3022250 RepID=UPI003BA0C870
MKLTHIIVLALSAGALSGCFSGKTPTRPAPAAVNQSALAIMERVALSAKQCWFKSGDPDFKKYSLAPELVSFTGRPRILVVPARNPNDRPLLVVQAEGSPARMERFGPMMQSPLADRIMRDTARWASGQRSC